MAYTQKSIERDSGSKAISSVIWVSNTPANMAAGLLIASVKKLITFTFPYLDL